VISLAPFEILISAIQKTERFYRREAGGFKKTRDHTADTEPRFCIRITITGLARVERRTADGFLILCSATTPIPATCQFVLWKADVDWLGSRSNRNRQGLEKMTLAVASVPTTQSSAIRIEASALPTPLPAVVQPLGRHATSTPSGSFFLWI
jgi:hypothetical protein